MDASNGLEMSYSLLADSYNLSVHLHNFVDLIEFASTISQMTKSYVSHYAPVTCLEQHDECDLSDRLALDSDC